MTAANATVTSGRRDEVGRPGSGQLELPEAMSEPVNVIEPMMMSSTMKMCVSIRTAARGEQAQVVLDRDERRRAAADRVEQRHELRHRGHRDGAGRVTARGFCR